MLVSHAHRFIYTKTLKTAGTSVEIYFEDACLPPGHTGERGHAMAETVTPAGIVGHRGGMTGLTWYNHMPASVIRDQIGGAIWADYFKFCVIRNPFDKLVSYWWMHLAPAVRTGYRTTDFAVIREQFSSWAALCAPAVVDRHTYMIDGAPCMDLFIRYEALLDGIQAACQRVDYPFRPDLLGRFKSEYRERPEPFSDYFDTPAAAAVTSAFGWEIERFGYRLHDEAIRYEREARLP